MASAATSYDIYLDPPSPVVALVGAQELHGALTSRPPASAANEELQARYLSLPADTNQLDRTPSEEGHGVVLKRDWLH